MGHQGYSRRKKVKRWPLTTYQEAKAKSKKASKTKGILDRGVSRKGNRLAPRKKRKQKTRGEGKLCKVPWFVCLKGCREVTKINKVSGGRSRWG